MAGLQTKKLPSGKYRGWFMDKNGKQKYFTGTRSKADTLELARKYEDQHRLQRLGFESPILQAERQRATSFTETKGEYLEWGQTQGGRRHGPWGDTHTRNRRAHLSWWQDTLRLNTIADLDGILPSVEKLLRSLQREGLSNKTLNNYAEALRAFCNWCIKHDYLDKDPLRHLKRFDESIGTLRRAMTVEEIHLLRKHSPDYRWLLYETALETGLRAKELSSLITSDLDLEHHHLRLHKAWTKNRKDGYQPLSPELTDRLLKWIESGQAKKLYETHYSRKTAEDTIPSKPLLYVPTHTARTLDLDLAAAGIPKETDEGKLDFHALRTTFITLAIESPDTNVKEVQTLARHSSVQITFNHYARVRSDRLTKVVSNIGDQIRGGATNT